MFYSIKKIKKRRSSEARFVYGEKNFFDGGI